jgi:hypothetical protein
MSAYFCSEDRTVEEIWVGSKLEMNPDIVSIVTLSGHELELVQHHFSNLPTVNLRVVTYHGDFAKFIAAHWNYLK